MFNSKNKKIIDQELEIYKQQQQLIIDQEIHNRKVNNWTKVDEARRERMDAISEVKSELAKLEALKETIQKEITFLKDENKFLRDTVALFAEKKINANISTNS
jgi:Rps23 Pro-64 3,4-dihydroxylase Tpa1-like proline 4-hydroxylase